MTDDAIPDGEAQRSLPARFGIAALNLVQPGIGLLRLGAPRSGVLLIAVPLVWLLASVLLFAVGPRPNFAALVIFAAATIAMVATIVVVGIIVTWRRSRGPVRPAAWFGRWYALVVIALVTTTASQLAVRVCHYFYRPFYIPSTSMVPTLMVPERFVADMRAGRQPAIGDIVLIQSGAETYVKRVIALPGDHISMAADIPTVNGIRAFVQAAGTTRFRSAEGDEQAALLHERLPGEIGSHDIAIAQASAYGDMAERTVPPDHVFVLGDNREQSADSRLPLVQLGLDMVPISAIVGQPLYISWSSNHGRIGRPINH